LATGHKRVALALDFSTDTDELPLFGAGNLLLRKRTGSESV